MPGKTDVLDFGLSDPGGFNEAPAKCRGKPVRTRCRPRMRVCFNEAPAKCRGKQKLPIRKSSGPALQ